MSEQDLVETWEEQLDKAWPDENGQRWPTRVVDADYFNNLLARARRAERLEAALRDIAENPPGSSWRLIRIAKAALTEAQSEGEPDA